MNKSSWTSSIGLPAAAWAGAGDAPRSGRGAGTMVFFKSLQTNMFFRVLTIFDDFLTTFDAF
jgi:hypothetical protein